MTHKRIPNSQSSRRHILNKIRQRLAVRPLDQARITIVENRLSAHAANTMPAAACSETVDLVKLFSNKITTAKASVVQATTLSEVPKLISEYLSIGKTKVCLSDDINYMKLSFNPYTNLEIVKSQPKASLDCCVSSCFAAIAETGSLVITSSEQNAITETFLSDTHIVILKADSIVSTSENIWKIVRDQGGFPRDLTFVSGPSCTGDIEMVMEYGAHGPRSLHVIIVSDMNL